MRLRPTVAVAVALGCAPLLAHSAPGRQPPGELGKLRGEWELVSTADEQRGYPGIPESHMVIGADGTVALKVSDLITNAGTIRLGKSGRARVMDLKLDSGLVLGVYELDGDELTICCDEPSKARPAGMTPEGTQWVETWRRVRP